MDSPYLLIAPLIHSLWVHRGTNDRGRGSSSFAWHPQLHGISSIPVRSWPCSRCARRAACFPAPPLCLMPAGILPLEGSCVFLLGVSCSSLLLTLSVSRQWEFPAVVPAFQICAFLQVDITPRAKLGDQTWVCLCISLYLC